jgi:hypothetical protein
VAIASLRLRSPLGMAGRLLTRRSRRFLLEQRKRLPESCRGVRLLATPRRSTRLCPAVGAPAGKEEQEHDDQRPPVSHAIVRGVPTGINAASRRMSGLRMRMQPWEMRPGISPGSSVP